MDKNSKNCLSSLLTELKRIELKLQLQVVRLRTEARQTSKDKIHDLYISESEVDTILGSPPFASGEHLPPSGNPVCLTFAESIKQKEAEIEQMIAALGRES